MTGFVSHPMTDFDVKDSGEREEYESGMVRDAETGKVDYTYTLPGPMLDRWANHLMKGAEKYERDNWLLGESDEEYHRARRSAARHMIQWLRGETDEDHAAAVFFNLNAAEYFLGRLATEPSEDHPLVLPGAYFET